MDSFQQIFEHLLNAEKLIHYGGFGLILLVVFIENGLFFGFFLPGDTLLFTTGLLCATGQFHVSIILLLSTISLAAIAGSMIGYYFGKKMGEALYNRPDTFFFKKKHVTTANDFFTRHGGAALIVGKFLPIIRTFAPIFGGVVKYPFRQFLSYIVIGSILWVFSMLLAGYFLGSIFPESKKYIEYIIIGIVILTWIPVVRTYLQERKHRNKTV